MGCKTVRRPHTLAHFFTDADTAEPRAKYRLYLMLRPAAQAVKTELSCCAYKMRGVANFGRETEIEQTKYKSDTPLSPTRSAANLRILLSVSPHGIDLNVVILRFRAIKTLGFLVALTALSLVTQGKEKVAPLTKVEIKEPNGQILSYRYLSGSTEVMMFGTNFAPDARVRLKIGSRPGFVELDINRGQITGLKPANQFGKDFLTYVLWAVSVDGKASNLGEITFDGEKPISVNVTTPYQTFWLMLTAEPSYAVVDPSRLVVLYSAADGRKKPSEKVAETVKGKLFYYTHYPAYDTKRTAQDPAPNALLQARKAVELAAAKSASLTSQRSKGPEIFEETQTLAALGQARDFLKRAEEAYKKDPNSSDVAQFSRTAAQIAENARALAQGAVGNAQVNQLQNEMEQLRQQLADQELELKNVVSAPRIQVIESIPEMKQSSAVMELISMPLTWFGVAGWLLALLLLFRRRTV